MPRQPLPSLELDTTVTHHCGTALWHNTVIPRTAASLSRAATDMVARWRGGAVVWLVACVPMFRVAEMRHVQRINGFVARSLALAHVSVCTERYLESRLTDGTETLHNSQDTTHKRKRHVGHNRLGHSSKRTRQSPGEAAQWAAPEAETKAKVVLRHKTREPRSMGTGPGRNRPRCNLPEISFPC